jgi:hypothetical protein
MAVNFDMQRGTHYLSTHGWARCAIGARLFTYFSCCRAACRVDVKV